MKTLLGPRLFWLDWKIPTGIMPTEQFHRRACLLFGTRIGLVGVTSIFKNYFEVKRTKSHETTLFLSDSSFPVLILISSQTIIADLYFCLCQASND